jgi:hypothetical protein
MMKKPVKKKDSLASRARAKALEDSMKAAPTRRAMASDKPPMAPPAAMPKGGAPAAMATPSDMSASPGMAAPGGMAPPGGAPMGMKRGGKVDFSKIVRNTKTGKLSEKPGMKSGGKTPPKKGGLMVMIAMGKKKGR